MTITQYNQNVVLNALMLYAMDQCYKHFYNPKHYSFWDDVFMSIYRQRQDLRK